MFQSNNNQISLKFKQYSLTLKKELNIFVIDSEQSLAQVRTLLKENKRLMVLLNEEYSHLLKELYLLGALYVEKKNELDYFLSTALIAAGEIENQNLGAMPFNQTVEMLLLHPVISVKKDQITILKSSEINNIEFGHTFWKDKVVDKTSNSERFLSINFHSNVQRISKKNQDEKIIVSNDKILIYSTSISQSFNIHAKNLVLSNTLEDFFMKLNTSSYDFIFFESKNGQSPNLHSLVKDKIQRLQSQAQIVFLNNCPSDNVLYIAPEVQAINLFLQQNNKDHHYSLKTLASWIYTKERFKICRINSHHVIIASEKFINPNSLLLLKESQSLVKIYKNNIIGNKYYYRAHLEHLSEENYKKFSDFLDKNSKVHYN